MQVNQLDNERGLLFFTLVFVVWLACLRNSREVYLVEERESRAAY